MKYAIVLTGQLRSWEFCKHIISNIKQHYDVDLFLSIDLCNILQCLNECNSEPTSTNEVTKAIDFYKPIAYYYNNYYNPISCNKQITNPNYKFNEFTNTNIPYKNRNYILGESFDNGEILKFNNLFMITDKGNNISLNKIKSTQIPLQGFKILFEQYFYVYKGYELLEKHIKNTNTKYDSIIRLRFDQLIWNRNTQFYFPNGNIIPDSYNTNILINELKKKKINLDTSNDNEICVLGGGIYKNYGYVNDQYWCHNMEQISMMKNFYIELPSIIQDCINTFYPIDGCGIEHFFARYLHKNNCTIKLSKLAGIFVRNKLQYKK
jgi:hypothetical protein